CPLPCRPRAWPFGALHPLRSPAWPRCSPPVVAEGAATAEAGAGQSPTAISPPRPRSRPSSRR
ncbi:MAG: hypothetical protein AVDCRST_MAG51-957, partial [uncultured Ramlibacter sp.]